MTHHSATPRRLPSSRSVAASLALVHFSNGGTQPAWAPYTDDLIRSMGISPAGFGTVMLGQAVGLWGGAIVAPRVAARIGLRWLLGLGALGYWAFLPAAGLLSDSPVGFFLMLLASAFANALLDVAWGIQSTSYEARQSIAAAAAGRKARRTHVAFQAFNGGGALLASVAGTYAQAHGVSILVPMLCVAGFALAGTLCLAVPTLPTQIEVPEETAGDAGPWVIAGLAAVCYFGGLVFGTCLTWASVLIREVDPATTLVGGGVVVFVVSQAIGQVIGGALSEKWIVPWPLAVAGSFTALVGAVVVVTNTNLVWCFVGLGALGLGCAFTWPFSQSLAARVAPLEQKARVVSNVTLAMYFGIASSALVGLLAELVGMQRAFGLLIVIALLILGLAGTAMRNAEPPGQHAGSA